MQFVNRTILIIMLTMCSLITHAKTNSSISETSKTAHNIIENYYTAVKAQDLPKFLNLLSDNVVHEINQGDTETGKALFKTFMENQFSSGKINIKDLIILTSPDGKYATSRFICSGTYTKTAKGYPPAKNQHWEIPVVSFFQIHDGKISHVAVYFNDKEYLKQLS